MRHFRLPGVRLAYDLHAPERPTGDPVLLIMGFQARGSAWRGQVERLVAEGRTCVTFDNRGVGETQARPGPWTTRTLARDALSLMDRLAWERAHVVGVSMGGMIAQELALRPRAKGRVRSLTLVATHPGGAVHRLPTADGLRRFVMTNGVRGRGGGTRARERLGLLFPLDWLDGLSKPQRDALMADLRRSFTGPDGNMPTSAYRLSQLSVVLSHDTRSRLGRIDAPTLVVRPGKDLLVRPAACAALARAIPGAEVLELPEAGHGVLRQCRQQVNDALVAHLARADESGRVDREHRAA